MTPSPVRAAARPAARHRFGDAAVRNLLRRDELFTERLGTQARELRLRSAEVDVTVSEDDLMGRVGAVFGH